MEERSILNEEIDWEFKEADHEIFQHNKSLERKKSSPDQLGSQSAIDIHSKDIIGENPSGYPLMSDDSDLEPSLGHGVPGKILFEKVFNSRFFGKIPSSRWLA
ncbi:hypothetical protein HAX54_017249 [Datura stramonium]|uniref:Uncharacterized protein n=1 Tax=Datura stramonium TaxID=4076 RepID=A0ABS8UKB1_DATST|nr:hypothetical protein [Datura stramonium]